MPTITNHRLSSLVAAFAEAYADERSDGRHDSMCEQAASHNGICSCAQRHRGAHGHTGTTPGVLFYEKPSCPICAITLTSDSDENYVCLKCSASWDPHDEYDDGQFTDETGTEVTS